MRKLLPWSVSVPIIAQPALPSIAVFATCPQSSDHERGAYLRQVVDVARWAEEQGCAGTLVYTDNRLVDPWLVAQIIIENTARLCPLVAVQPVYMHPYSVAKMVASLGHLHGRRVFLNMVAGGFANDLAALDDQTPHDRRYARLCEYTRIILDLLRGRAVTCEGAFYRVTNLKLSPPLPEDLLPGVFVSGSSPAGMQAAAELGATAVRYPRPAGEDPGVAGDDALGGGMRVGIITRPDGEEAWRVARARFPEDRRGQITHELAMKTSDSSWHQQLSRLAQVPPSEEHPYWLVPFQNYKTFCPYLVGGYDRVTEELARYMTVGYRTFILDIPPSAEELRHTGEVFRRAERRALR